MLLPEPHLVSGIGVDPQNAYDEMCAVKRVFGKTDKRLYSMAGYRRSFTHSISLLCPIQIYPHQPIIIVYRK